MKTGAMEHFKKIGLIGRIDDAPVVDSLQRLMDFLVGRNLTVILEEEIAGILAHNGLQVSHRTDIGDVCDLLIVVGGDGSMLSAARDIRKKNVAVLGVNRGRLGFLTDISPSDVESKVADVLSGKYTVEERFLFNTRVERDGEIIGKGSALNDVVVSSGEVARMIEFETYIDDQFVYSQRSDGLILSTPTGSTAYSLSGGGPIMHPKLDVMLLTPMFPHTLSGRPIVVDGNSVVKMVISSDNQIHPVITCDGHLKIVAKPGDTVYIQKKSHTLTMIHPLDHNFYAVCREKLGWGNRLGE